MSRIDVDTYFAKLPVWMQNDVRREVQLARASSSQAGSKALEGLGIEPGGGNPLAALGLVSYTEALGRIRLFNGGLSQAKPEECFLAFDEMAQPRYRDWRLDWERKYDDSLYEALRCGLVHEYQPKVDSELWIGEGHDLGLADEHGKLIFKAESYLRDFSKAVDGLHAELIALDNPVIPAAQRRRTLRVRIVGQPRRVVVGSIRSMTSIRRTS